MILNKALKRFKNKRDRIIKQRTLYNSNNSEGAKYINYYDGVLEGLEYAISILEKYKEQQDKKLYNKL